RWPPSARGCSSGSSSRRPSRPRWTARAGCCSRPISAPRSASVPRPWSSGRATTRRSGPRTGGTPTARPSTTRRSWPRPSRDSASSSHHMCFQGPLGIRVRDGGEMEEGHLPVLVDEVIEMLAPAPGSLHIDATLGAGGHTERILEAASPEGRVLGVDADPAAIHRVEVRLRARFGERLGLRPGNFRELATTAPEAGFGAVDGALFDLGLSSYQLADRDRGFGFRAGGPLDMRFDTTRGVPASDLIATLSADELAALFRK